MSDSEHAFVAHVRRNRLRQEDQFYQRQRVHLHNSFQGHLGMLRANMNSIMRATTTTEEAKQLALRIQDLGKELAEHLKTRIDPEY